MAKSNRSGVWQRTMVIVGFVLVLGFGAVITNLVRLQLVNGETLKTDAVDQSLQSTQLTPSRGTIYDATGTKVLAQSASVWTVALEPNYIDEGDDVKIAKGLSEILGLDYDAVLKKAQQNSYFVYVKRKVETEVRDEIVQYIKDEKIGRGITLMEDYKRYYPYGTTASTVLGFTGTDNQGRALKRNTTASFPARRAALSARRTHRATICRSSMTNTCRRRTATTLCSRSTRPCRAS